MVEQTGCRHRKQRPDGTFSCNFDQSPRMSRTGVIYREPDPKRRIIMITPHGITANCIAADKVEAQICEQKSDAIAEYLANQ